MYLIKKNLLVTACALTLISGSCKIIQVKNEPIYPNNPQDKLGDMSIPSYKKEDFTLAAILVVKIINSETFKNRLKDSVAQYSAGGAYSAAWTGWDTDRITTGMRAKIQGLTVETYGGPFAAISHWFSGNIANDGNNNAGTATGPIKLNRTGMPRHTIADLCNTIAHEAAHRVGMTHPHSNTDLTIAFKEPPYIVGSLVHTLAIEAIKNGINTL
ncbi:hypothetical protein [Mucilaginibacter flavus]|uniref:hypothetical protein n=1 Tax=Mucilaginibacter flavus TaxID=931504 RepID=UPI0025B37337|nr:hypothetical protein [Mucilaginibacter flavus]MDN3579286.1 hypothetical protein [Mucilaginibacter flavus]